MMGLDFRVRTSTNNGVSGRRLNSAQFHVLSFGCIKPCSVQEPLNGGSPNCSFPFPGEDLQNDMMDIKNDMMDIKNAIR